MRRSEGRILTTHTGSLQRPASLTRLYVRRARGEAVDEAAVATAGRESGRDPRRVLAGTDRGFDTAAGRGRLAADVVWSKLRALSECARLASARLFGRAAVA